MIFYVLHKFPRNFYILYFPTIAMHERGNWRGSYLFILTVLPPLQQLCSPISRSYFKELHNYTILPVMIFIQLLQHAALTCLSHFEDGLFGRPLSAPFLFRTSGKGTDMATPLGPEKYGRIDFSLGRWTTMGQNAPKLELKHAKEQVELVRIFLRSLLRPQESLF